MVEEYGSHGGQGEPDEHGEGRDAGHVQGVEQVRGHDGSRLAEQEGHEQPLEDVPGYLMRFLGQGRDRTSSQGGATRGTALMNRRYSHTFSHF